MGAFDLVAEPTTKFVGQNVTYTLKPIVLTDDSNNASNALQSWRFQVLRWGPLDLNTTVRLTKVGSTSEDLGRYLIGTVTEINAADVDLADFIVTVTSASVLDGTTIEQVTVTLESAALNETLDPQEALGYTEAFMGLSVDPPLVFEQNLVMAKHAVFDVEPYFVVEGYPVAATSMGATINITGGVGSVASVPSYPPFYDVNMGSDARWVAVAGTFADGSTWSPYSGGSRFELYSSGEETPTLLDSFSRQFKASLSAGQGAMQFSAGNFESDAGPWSSGELTVLGVAQMGIPDDEFYGVFSSGGNLRDPSLQVRFDRQGYLSMYAGDALLGEFILNSGLRRTFSPLIVGFTASLLDRQASLVGYDGTRKVAEITIPYDQQFGASLLVGSAPTNDGPNYARMYMLEMDVWRRRLVGQELYDAIDKLNHIYEVG